MSDPFDLVVIGAGEAGQAAAYAARDRGASVAIVDRELFGGLCPYWACVCRPRHSSTPPRSTPGAATMSGSAPRTSATG